MDRPQTSRTPGETGATAVPELPTCSKCHGVLLWDSDMMAKGQDPKCTGLLLPAHAKRDAFSPIPVEMGAFTHFRYACVGKAIFERRNQDRASTSGRNEPQNVTRSEAFLPDCRFLRVTSMGQGAAQPHTAGAPPSGTGREREGSDGAGKRELWGMGPDVDSEGGETSPKTLPGKVLDKSIQILQRVPATVETMFRAARRVAFAVEQVVKAVGGSGGGGNDRGRSGA